MTKLKQKGDRPRICLAKVRPNPSGHFHFFPHYGIACLSAYLKQRMDCEILQTDLMKHGGSIAGLIAEIHAFDPDIVGLSATSEDIENLDEVYAKLFSDGISPIVIGGPYPSIASDDIIRFPGAIFVIGEGEETLLELTKAFFSGEDLGKIRGIAFMRDRKPVITERRPLIPAMDIPTPDWDSELFKKVSFNMFFSMTERTSDYLLGQVMTSRGCIYNCSFCHNIFGRKVRTRPIDSVLKEITDQVEMGVTEFSINDDLINVPHNRFIHLMEEMAALKLGLPFSFWNGIRADAYSREDLERLKAAGGAHVLMPVESASPRIQKLMNKNLNIEKVRENWKIARDVGLLVQSNFIFGWPDATREDLEMDLEVMEDENLHGILVMSPVLCKGLGLYDQAVAARPEVVNEWRLLSDMYLYKASLGSVYNLTRCSDDELGELTAQAAHVAHEVIRRPESVKRLARFNLRPREDEFCGHIESGQSPAESMDFVEEQSESFEALHDIWRATMREIFLRIKGYEPFIDEWLIENIDESDDDRLRICLLSTNTKARVAFSLLEPGSSNFIDNECFSLSIVNDPQYLTGPDCDKIIRFMAILLEKLCMIIIQKTGDDSVSVN